MKWIPADAPSIVHDAWYDQNPIARWVVRIFLVGPIIATIVMFALAPISG